MPLTVEKVQTPKDLHTFVTLPWGIYRDDPHWVPPLIGETKKLFHPEKNPFFEHGEIEPYLARRDGTVVGRIAAVRNRAHEEFHEESVGFFGFFESADDPEAASALMDAAREFVRSRNLRILRGPMNPSTNEECGMLVEGFDTDPMVMMTHNPPYYDALMGKCGLAKAKDLVAFILEADSIPDRVERGVRIARKRNPDVVVRPMNMKKFDAEVDAFRVVYNGAWERNWGFVPMTDNEVTHMAKQLKPVVDPDLIRIAEHEGRPVAFALALPDMNHAVKHANGRLFPFGLLKILWHARKNPRMRTLALGILEPYRKTGLDMILYHDLFKGALDKGYRQGEFSWILEDNLPMIRPIESMGARRYKTYRIYESPVGG
jgi:GNAT superfamily N-acetyltransferase